MEASGEEDGAGKKDLPLDEDDFSLKLSDEEGKSKSDSDSKIHPIVSPSFSTIDPDPEKSLEPPDIINTTLPDTSTLMLPPLSSMAASKPSLDSLPNINCHLPTPAIPGIPPTLSPTKTQSSFSPAITSSKKVPLDMMPTIPLVPVQFPNPGRGNLVNVATKVRGRPRGLGSQFGHSRQTSLAIRNRIRGKKLGSFLPRGGRRLVHSTSLDDKRMLSMKDDSYLLEEDVHYAHDDMSLMPSYQEKWPGKICAFCCLAENSQLGQGDMLKYDATPGFSPFQKPQICNDTFGEEPFMKKFKPSISFREKYKYRKPFGEALTDFAEELSLVGFSEKPNLASIFNDTGQCFAHYMCALWSSEIELAADDTIACVDKAVVIAVDKKCLHCKKSGASIPCRVPDCPHWYHFPCATAAGAFMDLKSIAMVCQPHALKAKDYLVDMCCMMCEKTHPESSLLFCCTCGNHYHGMCLKPTIRVTSIIRTGWQCQDCKICQICRQPADEVMCGVCDRAYHIGCARPQGLTHSRTDWKCKSCRVCGDCGSRTPGNGLSSRWHANFSVCDSCYQLRNKGLACPVCKKAYRAIMQKNMAQCSICSKHVHNHCDTEADLGTIHAKRIGDSSYEYQCLACRINPTARLQAANDLIQSSDTDMFDTESPLLVDDLLDNEDSASEASGTVKKIGASNNPTSQFSGLSLLVGGAFTCPPQHSASGPATTFGSVYPKGKPFVGRRGGGSGGSGGGFYNRPRGSFNKYTIGKRNLSSSRVRGDKAGMQAPRKGRGGSSTGKGYRGYFNYTPVTLQVMENNHSTGKEEGEENKLILVNSSDQYSLMQDICAMCGSFGQDQEGRLICCAQCGQCYHPYCANVKVNRVVLEKGWRCLDCTVCEGCGERNDESRLVLCEDCDISCHIYCMTPPLEQVPAGIWKCKWCAVCQYCGTTSPGVNSTWQQNYSMCGPCFSLTTCPVCEEAYSEAELIIQCSNCVRWLHASDDMINTEDDAERCIEKGYLCLMCRSPDSLPPHLLLSSPKRFDKEGLSKGSSALQGQMSLTLGSSTNWLSSLSPTRSNSPVDFLSKVNLNAVHKMDGTYLSEVGLHHIQNQTIIPPKKVRSIRGLRASRGPSLDSTGSRDLDEDDDEDFEKIDMNSVQQHWVFGMKEGTILNVKDHGNPPILPDGYYTLKGPDPGTFILRKRRYRNIKTVGIGGFQVRVRARKDEGKAREEAEMDPQALELRRKRSNWRTKKKIKLLEKFPSYIQEAFFGRNLMDTSTLDEEKHQIEKFDEEETRPVLRNESIRLSQDEVKLISAAKEKHELEKCKSTEEFPVSEAAPAAATVETKDVKRDTTSAPVPTPAASTKQPPTNGSGTLPIVAPVQPKIEEKKPKEEKVDDFAEDDENNDAIEALFGTAGSDFLSDDLVRDLINGDMKDESDRDQMDTDEDPGKLSDLLGPGFNLQDVADIMKTLPVENHDESGQQQQQQVQQNIPSKTVAGPPINQQATDIHPASATNPMFPSNIANSQPLLQNKIVGDALQPNQMVPPTQLVGQTISNHNVGHVPQRAVPVQPYNLNFQPRQPMQVGYMDGNSVRCPRPPAQYPKTQIANHPPQQVMVGPPAHSPGGGNVRPMDAAMSLHTNKVVVSPYNATMSASPGQQRAMPGRMGSHITSYPASPYNSVESPSSNVVQSEVPKTTSTTNENQSLSLSLEEDEALGSKATKAAVLYCNIHKPALRSDVASSQEREKQIKRMWKNLNADERKLYAQKARENKKEYIKNKQDQQKALKSQEKDGLTAGSVPGPTHINDPQMGMSSSQLIQPQIVNNASQSPSLVQTNRMQLTRNVEDGPSDHVLRTQLGIAETVRSDTLNQMTNIVGQGNLQGQRMGINQFARMESTDQQNVVTKQLLPAQRNMEEVVYAQQQRVGQQHRPDAQQPLLRDVLQQQHGFNQSNRPQFRHPFPPVLAANQQVRLRLAGSNGNQPQGTAIYDPRMRFIVQQQNQPPQQQQQQHQIIQQPQSQLQHQQNQIDLQQKNQLQLQRQLLQQNQVHLQQTHYRQQQHNVVQVPQHSPQYPQHQLGQVHGAVQQPNKPHQIINSALPQSNVNMQSTVQQGQQPATSKQSAGGMELGLNKFPTCMDDSTQKKAQKNDLEDLENSSDLNHMEVELLSSIDSDFKDLLDFATSDQGKSSHLGVSKMPTNLFEGLCEEELKESEGKATTQAIPMADSTILQNVAVQKIHSPSVGSPVIPQGPPSGPPSGPATPGTPGSQSPMAHSLAMGQSMSSLSAKVDQSHCSQSSTLKPSAMMQQVTQSAFLGPLTKPLNPPSRPQQTQVMAAMPESGGLTPVDPFQPQQTIGQSQHMQSSNFMPSQQPLVGRVMGSVLAADQAGNSPRVRFSGPQPIMVAGQSQQQPQGGMIQHAVSYQRPGVGQQMQHYHSHIPSGPVSGLEHPPPPYSCPPSSYTKPQVMVGEDLVRPPLGSPLGPSPIRQHHTAPLLGAPPMMGGPPHRMPHLISGPLSHHRPLLLQEQPLLIEDIIEEERREQLKQQKAIASQQHALMQNQMPPHEGANMIRGPFQQGQSMPTQGPSANIIYPSGGPPQQITRPIRPPTDSGLHPALIQAGARPPSVAMNPVAIGNLKTIPPPPLPCDNPATEAEVKQQQQYEKWMNQQMQMIVSQQKYLEDEISQLRKQRKSLNSRQRTLKKNGQELSEHDQTELDRIQKEATIVQRHLDACRKSYRQHSLLTSEYSNKKNSKQKQIAHSSPTGMMASGQQQMMAGSPLGKAHSPLYSTPQSPLLSHSPSSQHNMGMSPMVGSPHTPGPSPVHTPVPQHSPHGMTIPSALPSPIEAGPFSPQTRMPSPNTSLPYQSQVISHHMMQPQGIRSYVPAHSPGTPSPQPGPASPHHMMVIKQGGYQPNQVMGQNVGPQVTLRHPYPQNTVPIRRPSGSGVVPITTGPAYSPGHVQPCQSPVPYIAMKPSPIQNDMRSPIPLSSPQMLMHAMDNLVSSRDPFGNPATSMLENVHSPLNHFPDPVPSYMQPAISNFGLGDSIANHIGERVSMEKSKNAPQLQARRAGAGAGGFAPQNAPIPSVECVAIRPFGLKGGTFTKSRWGHWAIGLKGGLPVGMESTDCEKINILDTRPSFVQSFAEPVSSTATDKLEPVSSTENVPVTVLKPFFPNLTSQTSYVSAVSIPSSQYPKTGPTLVFPERIKSEIPPSSRHHAVIGIPGGGNVSSQSPIYVNNALGAIPRPPKVANSTPPVSHYLAMPEPIQYSLYSAGPNKPSSQEYFSRGNVVTTSIPNDDLSSSLLSAAPIMSASVSSSVSNEAYTREAKLQPSLVKDVKVIASVANVSNQVSNVLVTSNNGPFVGTTVLPSVSSLTSKLPFASARLPGITKPTDDVQLAAMPNSYAGSAHVPASFAAAGTAPKGMGNPGVTLTTLPQPQTGMQYVSNALKASPPQSRLSSAPYTFHHLPQNKVPVLLTSGNTIVPSVQIISQQSFANASNSAGPPQYGLSPTGSGGQQTAANVVMQNNLIGHHHVQGQGSQVAQLPPLSTLNSSQLSKGHIIQSVGQYSPNIGGTGAHIIVQHQHNPNSMVLSSNGSQVRMVGQQVIMQQGMIRGNGVMVKSGPQVQGGMRMMMIHNARPRTPTPPPITKQTTPLMPPPSAATRSPVPHAASPVSRVSPSPSPNVASPRSPQVNVSPVPSPQRIVTSTPPGSVGQCDKSFAYSSSLAESENFLKDPTNLDGQASTVPNVLLKQLLQSATCSGNSVQHSGQLVLVRSSPSGNFPFNQSHQLSHIASQVPNPSLAAIQKNLIESKANSLNVQTINQTAVRTMQHPLPTLASGTNAQLDLAHLTRSDSNQQLTGILQTAQLPSSTMQLQHQHPVVLQQSSAGGNQQLVKANLSHSYATTKSSLSQFSEQKSVFVAQNMTKSDPSPSANLLYQSAMSHGATAKSVSIATPQAHHLSLSERIESNPSVKTEMCVVIPDNVSSPELHTPVDSCDDPEEAKKAKKRAQTQARRKSQCKDTTKAAGPQRMRQASKRIEDDYDGFVDNLMAQLRALPPIAVMEPAVTKNFNSCPLFSCSDPARSNKREQSLRHLQLEGAEGNVTIRGINDYYNTQPFGAKPSLVSAAKTGHTQKQFYNQVFTPPKIELLNEESSLDGEVFSVTKLMGGAKRELDSPDTVLSSSSPETCLPDSPPPFVGLKLAYLDDEPMETNRDRSTSPFLPLLSPIPSYPVMPPSSRQTFFGRDASDNKENLPALYGRLSAKNKVGLTPATPRKDHGNVDVTMTLCSQIGQDVSHVLRSLANLLNISPPRTYNLASSIPVESSLQKEKVKKVFQFRNKDNTEDAIDMQSVLNGSVRFCKQCNSVVEETMINKSLSLAHLLRENGESVEDFMFCSKMCYSQFSTAHRAIHEKTNLSHFSQSFTRMKTKELPGGNSRDLGSSSVRGWQKKEEVAKVAQLDPFNRSFKRKLAAREEELTQPKRKRPNKDQYKFWKRNELSLPESYEKPTDREMTDLLFRLRITFRHFNIPDDSRQCTLCHLFGDYLADGPSRLLNYDVDKWVHLNCGLWAEDVYETMNGSLMMMELGLKKSLHQVCGHCEQSGASVKCFKARCSKYYHLNCAVKEDCSFYKNKTVYCQEHINKGDKDNELSTLAVLRRVFIERDESRQIASVVHHSEMNQVLRIGSLVLISIGQLLPQYLQNFHSPYCIYPIGYKVIRFYWSMKRLHKRCAYECSIHEVNSMPEFRITVQEEGFDDVDFVSRSPKGVWNKILDPIADMRQKHDVVRLFPQYISGEDLFGLTEPAIVRILESMPGVETLTDYSCKYGSNPLFELPLAVNPSGCARSEMIVKGATKRHHGIRTAVGTVKSGSNARSAASMASFSMTFDPFVPFGKPYTHSRFFQYKKMTNEWRSTVYLARSKIQGLGLYAAKDIEKNAMIIEYIGEIIRGELSEVREKRYEAQNRGIYMFRLDDARVVDATVSGGLARYVNHSCDPNCYTETVEIERHFKIVICSNRKLSRGEELAYDYKFDEEEDHKIPCLCGADNCRKWMN